MDYFSIPLFSGAWHLFNCHPPAKSQTKTLMKKKTKKKKQQRDDYRWINQHVIHMPFDGTRLSFYTSNVIHVFKNFHSQPLTWMRSLPTLRPAAPVLWVQRRVSGPPMTRRCQSGSWCSEEASLCCSCSPSSLLESSSASCSPDCSVKTSACY